MYLVLPIEISVVLYELEKMKTISFSIYDLSNIEVGNIVAKEERTTVKLFNKRIGSKLQGFIARISLFTQNNIESGLGDELSVLQKCRNDKSEILDQSQCVRGLTYHGILGRTVRDENGGRLANILPWFLPFSSFVRIPKNRGNILITKMRSHHDSMLKFKITGSGCCSAIDVRVLLGWAVDVCIPTLLGRFPGQPLRLGDEKRDPSGGAIFQSDKS